VVRIRQFRDDAVRGAHASQRLEAAVHDPARRVQQDVLAPPERLDAQVDRALHFLDATLVGAGQRRHAQRAEEVGQAANHRSVDLGREREGPKSESTVQMREQNDRVDQRRMVRQEQRAGGAAARGIGCAHDAHSIAQREQPPRDRAEESRGQGGAARLLEQRDHRREYTQLDGPAARPLL
jgi:hypothetical protein